MNEPGGRFVHQNRWALEYATPMRSYVIARPHHAWFADLLFVVTFFACVLAGLFIVTLVAHLVIDWLMY
jgi:hypothetical protein